MAHSHRGPHPEGRKAGWKRELLPAGLPHLRRLQGDGGHCSGPTGLGGPCPWLPGRRADGFRRRRCTADEVCALEEAKACGDAVLLVLLEIKGAFDCLPHPVVQRALDLLGINGNLRHFISSFLEEPGVPQGSAVSPFLFDLALARLPAALPIDPHYPVNASIYADDIALWVRSPPHSHRSARSALQRALDTTAAYLSSISLAISASKTEAILLHPRAAARRTATRLHLEGVQLPWITEVTYLGLRIDHRLSWLPAVKTLHVQVLRVRKAVSQLLARGQGCTTRWALRLYDAAATSRLRYALPLMALPPSRLKKLELQHRAAIRLCLGAPRSSQVAATLAEAVAGPLSLLLLQQGLRHVDRLHHELPGVCKRRSPTCALQQTAASLLHEDHGGHLQVYVDGSVMPDTGSSTAACVVPALRKSRQCRLPDHATSAAAEAAGLHLAVDLLAEELPATQMTIYCDSKAALLSLQRPKKGQPWGRPALDKADGAPGDLQWLLAHVGIQGNEEADVLAKRAHPCVVPPSLAATANDFTSHRLRRHLLACHLDKRMSLGRPLRPLPQRGLARRETSLLLQLRISCCWRGARSHRHGLIASPSCASCGEPETLEHLLLACPAYLQQRGRLLQEFRRLGLPSARQEDILFPGRNELPALLSVVDEPRGTSSAPTEAGPSAAKSNNTQTLLLQGCVTVQKPRPDTRLPERRDPASTASEKEMEVDASTSVPAAPKNKA
ncbi:uncharacterized protein [Dermacentor andersoni]|uniref:uncharacterized protein n=1 Tax=Dermacentor andersoni TaxID=34620 RepID=UPI0021555EAB|nr:uncharacterized protein LOC126543295 [Dermacentor andersoni]